MMGTRSLYDSLFLSAFLLHLCFYYGVGAADPDIMSNRKALETALGGDSGNYSAPAPAPAPKNEDCPPPSPPPELEYPPPLPPHNTPPPLEPESPPPLQPPLPPKSEYPPPLPPSPISPPEPEPEYHPPLPPPPIVSPPEPEYHPPLPQTSTPPPTEPEYHPPLPQPPTLFTPEPECPPPLPPPPTLPSPEPESPPPLPPPPTLSPPEPEYPPPLPPPPIPPPPPEPECPPPPQSELSPRLQLVYPIIQDFRKIITCDPKGILKSWDRKDKNVCKFKGFFCDIVPKYNQLALSGVDFNGFQFGGKGGQLPLSGFIEKLPDITVFHANSNNFTGGIPSEISKLPYFYELDLSNNKLHGQFPMEVLGAKQLTFLDLRFNFLYGRVPPQVFLLDVDVIFINNNYFEHRLPDNLGSTPALYLTFANNKFTGPIPPSIGQANKTLLEVLFLNNKLTGCLPFEIGFLKMATVFDVSINYLMGPIPFSFQCLFKIEVLNLARNQFDGSVPEAICKLPNLGVFNLSDNYFTQVGPKCRKLIKKKVLDIKNNCIIDLPNQRSKAECAAFFAKPKYQKCHHDQSLYYIPCKKIKYYGAPLCSSYNHQPMAPAPSPLSYGALKPHRL